MSGSAIRLIASDLDGTLLGADGQLSVRTIEAIGAAHDAGVELIPATGRSFRTADHRVRRSPHIRTMVCSNGALVYDLVERAVLATRPLDGRVFQSFIAELRSRMPQLRFGWETIDGFGFEDGFDSIIGGGDAARLLGGPQHIADVEIPLKAFVAHPELKQVKLQRTIAPHLPESLNGATSGAPFIEVTAAGVDKAQTMSLVAGWRGVTAEGVLALGDQMNDAALLRWAGVSVAMGNATDEIKSLADVVAAPHSEDGAAAIIEAVARGEI